MQFFRSSVLLLYVTGAAALGLAGGCATQETDVSLSRVRFDQPTNATKAVVLGTAQACHACEAMWMPKIESCGRKNDRCDHTIAPCVREKDIRDHKIAPCVREIEKCRRKAVAWHFCSAPSCAHIAIGSCRSVRNADG